MDENFANLGTEIGIQIHGFPLGWTSKGLYQAYYVSLKVTTKEKTVVDSQKVMIEEPKHTSRKSY